MAISRMSKTEQVHTVLATLSPHYFNSCKEFQDEVWRHVKRNGGDASERFTRSEAKKVYELYK